ncbi:uncharacterized protein METZ01_LOCUS437511, partial [marine metagenome]
IHSLLIKAILYFYLILRIFNAHIILSQQHNRVTYV